MNLCGVIDLEDALKKVSDCQVVDLREPAEYQSGHIEGTISLPLSRLSADAQKILDRNKQIYLLCFSGMRARKAAQQLERLGYRNLCVVEGGLKAWTGAGKPVTQSRICVWSLDRQVRFTAGLLVLAGLFGGWKIHPYWSILSAFIGFGLMFSGITDTCGMAMLLSKMPWNRSKSNV